MLDVLRISSDLMRALRGKRSQPAFSRLLGFRSNAVYSFEHGRRHPEVSLFLKAALSANRGTPAELARFFELSPQVFEGRRAHSPRTVMLLVRHLVGSSSKSGVAAQLGIDRTTLGRWYGGKTEPRLPEFLALIQLGTRRLLEFVALFADLAKLPSTREVQAHLSKQRRLAYELPLSHAVLRALELEGYRCLPRHSAAFLAEELGIRTEDVVSYLKELEAAGQAARSGEHYALTEILTIDTRQDPEQNRRLKSFWAREALRRFDAQRTPPETLFSFNLFAISEQAFQRIRELHLAYYDQVRAIVEQSETSDRVVLMNLQLVPLRASR